MDSLPKDPLIEALIKARRERKFTQAHLAELAGISRRALVAIEGGGDCNLSTLRRLLRALDLEMKLIPAEYSPPTLEDVLAENEMAYQRPPGRNKP
ncbi:helix-turn-helix protein [compost metagenome]